MEETGLQKCIYNQLELVYPPFSNKMGEWFRGDEEVQECFAKSQIYFIGQKPQAMFDNIRAVGAGQLSHEMHAESDHLLLDVICQDKRMSDIVLRLDQFRSEGSEELEVQFGDHLPDGQDLRIVRILDCSDPDDLQLLYWATPERLLFDHWRGIVHVDSVGDYREFTTYDLHYVGISREHNSFTRLFEKAHEKRQRILSLERQRVRQHELSDEVTIFLFDLAPMAISVFDQADDTIVLNEDLPAKHLLIADAEKAFVDKLQTHYNAIKYENYPQGNDGLYSAGLQRYGYKINDNFTFNAPGGQINGRYLLSEDSTAPDLILVEGDAVRVINLGSAPENVLSLFLTPPGSSDSWEGKIVILE